MSVGAGTVTPVPAPALTSDPSGATVLAGRRRAILLFGITLAAGMDAISGTALSIGRIDMLGDTHATPDEFAWLGIAYLTAKLIAFVFAAWLGERFGANRSLLAAILLLTLASLGSALTADIDALIAWRLLQGAAGGVLLAGGQTMLLQVFPRRRQPLVQAVFAIGAVMAPTTLAPALQGWMVDSLSWTWIFLLNLPLGAAATAAIALGLPAAPPATRKKTRLDGIGLATLAIAMICVVFLLQQGSRWNWFDAPRIVYVSLLGGAALGGFVIRETYRQGHNPLLDFSAFRNAGFAFGFVVSFVAGFALSGSAFLVPSFALSVLDFSATWAGLLLLPSGILVGLGLLGAGLLVQYRGVPPFKLVPGGILLFMTAMWLLSGSTGESGPGDLIPALLLRGLGLGLLFVSLTLITLLGLEGDASAHGTGLFNAGKQLGGLIGIAALQTYLDHQAALDRSVLITHLTPGDPAFVERQAVLAQLLTSRGLDPGSAATAALGVVHHALQVQVAALSFDEAFLLVALLFVVAAPVLISLKLLLGRKNGVEAVGQRGQGPRQGPSRNLLPRLAAQIRRLRWRDAFPRVERLPIGRTPSTRPKPIEPALPRERLDGYADDLAAIAESPDFRSVTLGRLACLCRRTAAGAFPLHTKDKTIVIWRATEPAISRSIHTRDRRPPMLRRFLCAAALAAASLAAASAHDASDKATVTLVYDHVLPNVPGKSIRGVLVEYGPGGSSPAHTHASSAFIYATVLEGAIRSQVNDGPVITYHAGESFSEFPGDRHRVSANASTTEPARLLAVFVVDTDETILTTPDEN